MTSDTPMTLHDDITTPHSDVRTPQQHRLSLQFRRETQTSGHHPPQLPTLTPKKRGGEVSRTFIGRHLGSREGRD